MKRFVLFFILLVCLSAANADYTINDFNNAMQEHRKTSTNVRDFSNICEDFIINADDMNIVRGVTNYWMQAYKDNCVNFLNEKLKNNPDSKRFIYLNAIYEEDIENKLKTSRKLIKMDENWIDGYKLMASTYESSLFYKKADLATIESLKKSIKKDKKHLKNFVKLGENDQYAHQFNFRYLIYLGKLSKAKKYLDSLDKSSNGWLTNSVLAEFEVIKGNYDEAISYLKKEADNKIKKNKLSEENRENYYVYYMHAFFYDNELYKEYIDYVINSKQKSELPETYYYMARCNLKLNQEQKAVDNLFLAAEKGFADSHYLKENPDFESLKANPEWNNIIKAIDDQWKAKENERKKEVQAARLNKPAPQFQLTDINGNWVRLAELKGQYVLLDFWATWCGPCKQTMPLLDKWNRENNKHNVRVFSVNVWEKNQDTVDEFMKINNYSMELLYGNNELAQAYEVSGIPYICLIDKNGNIVYEEKGYNRELIKTIDWWMEALTSE